MRTTSQGSCPSGQHHKVLKPHLPGVCRARSSGHTVSWMHQVLARHHMQPGGWARTPHCCGRRPAVRSLVLQVGRGPHRPPSPLPARESSCWPGWEEAKCKVPEPAPLCPLVLEALPLGGRGKASGEASVLIMSIRSCCPLCPPDATRRLPGEHSPGRAGRREGAGPGPEGGADPGRSPGRARVGAVQVPPGDTLGGPWTAPLPTGPPPSLTPHAGRWLEWGWACHHA